MVGAHVRGRRGSTDRRRHRRRGAAARPAAALPDPARGPACAHRAPAPGCLAFRPHARGPARRRDGTDPGRARPPPETCNPHPEDTAMDLIEITQKERLGREEVAARLRTLADMLARHNDVEFDRGGMHFKVRVPDQINLKLELEVEDDGCEFEIELTW